MSSVQKSSFPLVIDSLATEVAQAVLAGEAPAPASVSEFLAAYREASCELVITIMKRGFEEHLVCAIAGGSVAAVSSVADSTDFYLLDRDIVPAWIARKAALGHAPVARQTGMRITKAKLKKLIQGSARNLESYFDGLFNSSAWVACSSQEYHSNAATNSVADTSFEFLGSQSHGWWIIEPRNFQLYAENTIAAQIWGIIIGLCAYENEVPRKIHGQ